ncbi:3'5'-cyclic nucleotide phosphodiesterase [Pelomyxa schiedti]|nr:3'5'-cyclic nucleotide phosphodiesterase [Pelomyxa schiedti]
MKSATATPRSNADPDKADEYSGDPGTRTGTTTANTTANTTPRAVHSYVGTPGTSTLDLTVKRPNKRGKSKIKKVYKAVLRATDKGVFRSVMASVGLVIATAMSVWLVWFSTSRSVTNLMTQDSMTDASAIIFSKINETVQVLFRQIDFFELSLSFNPIFFGENRTTEMWTIQAASLVNEKTQFTMILAPSNPQTFNALVDASLVSTLDIALAAVYKWNNTDDLFVGVKDGNSSAGRMCFGDVSLSSPVYEPVQCVDSIFDCPLLLRPALDQEYAFFDPVVMNFFGYNMFNIGAEKILYSKGTRVAWLFSGMQVPMLTDLLSVIDMGEDSFSYIIDSRGNLLAVLGSVSVAEDELGATTPGNCSDKQIVSTWALLQKNCNQDSYNCTACQLTYSSEHGTNFLEVARYHPIESVRWLVVISLSSTKYTKASKLSTRFSLIITSTLVFVLLGIGILSAVSLNKKRNSVCPEPKIDLDAGITKILDKLRVLKQHSSKKTGKTIDEIMANLTHTGGLFVPDLKKQTALLDTDIQKWLNEEIAPSKLSNFSPEMSSGVIAIPTSVVIDTSDNLDLGSMDFFVFGIPHEGILERVSMQVVSSLDLLPALSIPADSFRSFVAEIEKLYQENAYHNYIHAADVVQCLYYFLVRGLRDIIGATNYLDIFGLIVSGIVHDVGHPGVNNAFLIATENDLAIRYNDRSVLENFHSSVALRIISSKYAAEWKLSTNDKKYLRALIISLVLSTDMTQHFEIISKFKTVLEDPSRDLRQNKEHRTQLLCVAIKTADISNVMRPHRPMLRWVSQLTQEFYNQGDQERQLGIPLSPFTDRTEGLTKLSKLQTNFINIIAEPLLSTFNLACPVPEMMQCTHENYEYWNTNVQHHFSTSGEILPGPAPPPPPPAHH